VMPGEENRGKNKRDCTYEICHRGGRGTRAKGLKGVGAGRKEMGKLCFTRWEEKKKHYGEKKKQSEKKKNLGF